MDKSAHKYFSLLILLLSIYIIAGCHEGLSPYDELDTEAFFSGKIKVKGGVEAWPDSNEVFAIRVAGFKTTDPESLLSEVVEGNAYFTFLSIGEYFDEIGYVVSVPTAPATLRYTVVAWQFEDSLTSQRVAAVYGGDTPKTINLQPGDSITGIDFEIDFENLPPQPF